MYVALGIAIQTSTSELNCHWILTSETIFLNLSQDWQQMLHIAQKSSV